MRKRTNRPKMSGWTFSVCRYGPIFCRKRHSGKTAKSGTLCFLISVFVIVISNTSTKQVSCDARPHDRFISTELVSKDLSEVFIEVIRLNSHVRSLYTTCIFSNKFLAQTAVTGPPPLANWSISSPWHIISKMIVIRYWYILSDESCSRSKTVQLYSLTIFNMIIHNLASTVV